MSLTQFYFRHVKNSSKAVINAFFKGEMKQTPGQDLRGIQRTKLPEYRDANELWMCLLVPCCVRWDEKYCLRLRTVVCCWQKLSADFKLNSWWWELRVFLDHLENTEALISLAYFKDVFGKNKLPRYSTYPSTVGQRSEYGKSFTFQNLNSS